MYFVSCTYVFGKMCQIKNQTLSFLWKFIVLFSAFLTSVGAFRPLSLVCITLCTCLFNKVCLFIMGSWELSFRDDYHLKDQEFCYIF
jgi:hypothetical protein